MTNETTTTNAGGNKPIAYLYYSREAKRRGAKDRLIRCVFRSNVITDSGGS